MGTSVAGFASSGDSPLVDELIGSNAEDLLARKYTLLAGEKVVRGEVMAILDSGGKAVASVTGGSDGSQTPFGICAADADATGDSPDVDSQVDIFVRGSFNEHALVIGASHTIASIREGLRDKGIYIETPVKRYP
jgi:Bacteriophage lambda head decoration protein D